MTKSIPRKVSGGSISSSITSGSGGGGRRRNNRADRTYVNHDYVDHLPDPIYQEPQGSGPEALQRGPRGGVVEPFPQRLYKMLSEADQGFAHIVSWSPHGRCFIVHKPKEFVAEVLPK